MAIDRTKRGGIEARAERGRSAGSSDNEKALGHDITYLLQKIDRLHERRGELEGKVSDLEDQLRKLRERVGDD
jgi:predicted  nucleic acid-binding Zn-ribbon protein